jgi:hypothetical protein
VQIMATDLCKDEWRPFPQQYCPFVMPFPIFGNSVTGTLPAIFDCHMWLDSKCPKTIYIVMVQLSRDRNYTFLTSIKVLAIILPALKSQLLNPMLRLVKNCN